MNCIYKNKYRKDLDKFETTCYSAETGEKIDCADCKSCNCCKSLFPVNTDRNGIANGKISTNFQYGDIEVATYSDFVAAVEALGGFVTLHPVSAEGHQSFIEICGLESCSFSYDWENTTTGEIEKIYIKTNCEDCLQNNPVCYESQEYSYGADNTGTDYRWADATYKITLSDETCLTFTQSTASNDSWTAQLTEWSQTIQQVADDAGIVWLVEPRFVDNSNPTNIDGTVNGPGGTPSGLPGAPSSVIAQALVDQGMSWRYVNFQICPGEPVPVKIELLEVTDQGSGRTPPSLPYTLNTTKAILGPKNKFKVCQECKEGGDQWFILEGLNQWKEAESGELPFCYEPCGTLVNAPAPPENECSFSYDLGCDGSQATGIVQNAVTRRTTSCVGQSDVYDYFIQNPSDPLASVLYTLQEGFINCDSLEPIPVPPPVNQVIINCDDNTLTEVFDTDVRIVGAKNPIPVYQVAQCGEYIRTENIKLCEVDARYLLLIDSGGVFARYSFITGVWEEVSTLSVASAGGSVDVANFLLYNFVAPDQLTIVDVNTDTQLPNITLVDGISINPNVTTNPKTFSAASFRDVDGKLYAQDTAGADAGLYCINPTTGEVDFVTTISGVTGTGTSIAVDNTTDTLYVNGSNLSYQVDWITGVATQVANPPIQPNGSTFDTDGNWYVTQGKDTYYLPTGADGTDPTNWIQIIDDFAAGANSIAYYEVEAQKPSCFFRRYGILENGNREIIGDFQVTDDSPRTVVGEVDCCKCSCGNSGQDGGGESAITNFPPSKVEICDGTKTLWQVTSINSQSAETVTYEDETGEVAEPTNWTPGACQCDLFTYWELSDNVTGTLRNREWDLGPRPTQFMSVADGQSVINSFDFFAPTTIDADWNTLHVDDTNSDATIQDAQVIEGYIVVEEPMLIRYTSGSAGYFRLELGECCGEYSTKIEGATIDGTVNPTDSYVFPEGIHRIRMWNIDDWSNTARTLQYSTNGGATWINDNTPPNIQKSKVKPVWICKKGYICNGVFYDITKTVVLDMDNPSIQLCQSTCNNSSNSGGSSNFQTLEIN